MHWLDYNIKLWYIFLIKDKLFQRVYNYSRKHLSYKRHFPRLAILFGSNILLSVLIYFLTDSFKTYPDKLPFILLIFAVIIIGVLIDLTQENKQLRELKKQHKKYAQAFLELHNEYKMALKDIKSRDEFLSIVSHELKTPLTVMLLKLHNELQKIHSGSLANFSVHELMEVLKNSEQQIKWLKSMINDLLDVSLITTGRMNLVLEDTDLVSITKQIKMSFSEALKRKKYQVKIRAKAPVVGKWDKVRLEQVITNLLSNAIKYGEGKPIDIQVLRRGNYAKFIIKDNGIGIAFSEQKMIFDLFKRADGSGEYKKGLGVGLYISSQIVKIHGGKIKVASSPTKGSTFTIELPLKK